MRTFAIALAALAIGCSGTNGGSLVSEAGPSNDGGVQDATTGHDASMTGQDASPEAAPDATTSDAPSEASPPVDAGNHADACAAVCAGQCVDLKSDANNCGKCGNVCGPMHACFNGMCALNCPSGQHPCFSADVCIANMTCCDTGDCALTGATCPMPGGTCQCPSGQRPCNTTNSCISVNDCCTQQDCTVAGSMCSTPGQPCQCSNGEKACSATNSCIPQSACCTTSDCPSGQTCLNGMCI